MTEPIRIGIAGLGRAGWGMHCRELAGKEDLFQISCRLRCAPRAPAADGGIVRVRNL